MNTCLSRIALILLALCLAACANVSGGASSKDGFASVPHGPDYLPGNAKFYSFGLSQSKENFVNIEQAQSTYGLFAKEKYWQAIKPMRAPSTYNLLQQYYPLHVRWQLKDGRQFIAESFDVRAVMLEYFKKHSIKLQWQREGRPYKSRGDYYPAFVHEIRDDVVILKWLLIINRTPVDERFTSTGVANKWVREYEEHIVTTVKGTPTSGIDFERRVEISK